MLLLRHIMNSVIPLLFIALFCQIPLATAAPKNELISQLYSPPKKNQDGMGTGNATVSKGKDGSGRNLGEPRISIPPPPGITRVGREKMSAFLVKKNPTEYKIVKYRGMYFLVGEKGKQKLKEVYEKVKIEKREEFEKEHLKLVQDFGLKKEKETLELEEKKIKEELIEFMKKKYPSWVYKTEVNIWQEPPADGGVWFVRTDWCAKTKLQDVIDMKDKSLSEQDIDLLGFFFNISPSTKQNGNNLMSVASAFDHRNSQKGSSNSRNDGNGTSRNASSAFGYRNCQMDLRNSRNDGRPQSASAANGYAARPNSKVLTSKGNMIIPRPNAAVLSLPSFKLKSLS